MKISVIAHPNNKRPRVEEDLTGTIHVYVHEPPLEGRANLAVIESLSDHFGVKKSTITLLSGHKGKLKIFDIPVTS